MIGNIEGLNHIRQTDPCKALENASKEFESVFAYQLLKTMGESMPDGLFGSDLASDFYKDMLFQSVAKSVSQTGSLGIGEIVRRRMEALVGCDEAGTKQEDMSRTDTVSTTGTCRD